MKIKKTYFYSNKLFKLRTIKTSLTKSNLNEDLECYFKKALSIIYKYHVNHKEIVFIGLLKYIDSNFEYLFKHFNHVIVPDSLWIKGLITNKNFTLKSLAKSRKNSNVFQIFRSFTKKKDLIVILDSVTNKFALEENYNVRVPLITFCNPPIVSDLKSTYKIPVNCKSTEINFQNYFFLSLIISVLRKADNLKKHKMFNNFNWNRF